MRRSLKYGLYGAVLAGVTVAATAAFATPNDGRSITLVVDGTSSKVTTTASDVGAARQGWLHPRKPRHRGPRPVDQGPDGATIVSSAAACSTSPSTEQRDVWTTAPTVSRRSALGFSSRNSLGLAFQAAAPHRARAALAQAGAVVHDGATTALTTTDSPSRPAEGRVRPGGPDDQLVPAVTAPVAAGMKIVVKRVTHGGQTRSCPCVLDPAPTHP